MFGMWNSTAQQNRNYAWQNFTNGNQVAFMDPYVVSYPREGRNVCPSPTNGICTGPDPRWDNFRDNLGTILKYSAQAESCERPAEQLPLFHQQLSGADAGGRAEVPDLRPKRRLVHRQPLGDGQFANAQRGVVQSVHGRDDRRWLGFGRIVVTIVYAAVQRRRRAVSGRFGGTRGI